MSAFWMSHFCLLLGLLCAMLAGVFLSFSDFIMTGLRRSDSAAGLEAMQNINRTVFRSIFVLLFIALGAMSLCFTVFVTVKDIGAGQTLIASGSAIYLIAVFMVTIYCNVPMNKRLEKVDKDSEEGAIYWDFYSRRWTLYNHIRTIGCIAAALCFLIAADRCHY